MEEEYLLIVKMQVLHLFLDRGSVVIDTSDRNNIPISHSDEVRCCVCYRGDNGKIGKIKSSV